MTGDIAQTVGRRGQKLGYFTTSPYRSATTTTVSGELAAAYVVERIVHRRDFDAAAAHLPAPDDT